MILVGKIFVQYVNEGLASNCSLRIVAVYAGHLRKGIV